MLDELIKSFVMILVIMDPFGGIPVFLSLTKNFNVKRMRRSAKRATWVASLLIFTFLFLGNYILAFFSISLESFKIAGGVILLILGITYVFDIKLNPNAHYKKDITVPMATPLIAGPGVLTATIILVSLYGIIIPLIAAILNLFIFWVLMRFSNHMHDMIGDQGSEILTRIMGLILTSIAVEFIVTGIKSFL